MSRDEPQLHQLPAQRPRSDEVLGDERVARDLHGDRAESLAHAERADVAETGAHEAAPVEPVVVVEAAILGGEERLAHVLRHLLDRHVDAADDREPAHEPTLAVEDLAALGRPERADLVARRAAVEAAGAQPHVERADAHDREEKRSEPRPLRSEPTSSGDLRIGSRAVPEHAPAVPHERLYRQGPESSHVSHMTPRRFCKVSTRSRRACHVASSISVYHAESDRSDASNSTIRCCAGLVLSSSDRLPRPVFPSRTAGSMSPRFVLLGCLTASVAAGAIACSPCRLAHRQGCRRRHGRHRLRADARLLGRVPALRPSHPAAMPRRSGVPNELGRIPVFEYHLIAEKNSVYERTHEGLRRDLEMMYSRGYRPVSMAELIDKKIDLPAGQSPVVLVFDDASPSQFRYIEKNGQLEIDPDDGRRHSDGVQQGSTRTGATARCSACCRPRRPGGRSSATRASRGRRPSGDTGR